MRSKALKWYEGPPPSMGWWPASKNRDECALRWWDGHHWSRVAWAGWPTVTAVRSASVIDERQHSIEWRARPTSWPARSFT